MEPKEPKFEKKMEPEMQLETVLTPEGNTPASESVLKREDREFRYVSAKAANQMMIESKTIFPNHVRTILEKIERREALSREEYSMLYSIRSAWWREKFGVSFE